MPELATMLQGAAWAEQAGRCCLWIAPTGCMPPACAAACLVTSSSASASAESHFSAVRPRLVKRGRRRWLSHSNCDCDCCNCNTQHVLNPKADDAPHHPVLLPPRRVPPPDMLQPNCSFFQMLQLLPKKLGSWNFKGAFRLHRNSLWSSLKDPPPALLFLLSSLLFCVAQFRFSFVVALPADVLVIRVSQEMVC